MPRISELGTQSVDGKDHLIGYHSYTFNSAESNYPTSEKKMLAVLRSAHYIRSYLDGQKFLLHTDQSALKELLTTKEPKGRTARWIYKLAKTDFKVVHKPGKTIGHADALSRLPQEAENVMCISENTQRRRIVVQPDQKLQILEEYHDSPDFGGHDGRWRTYLKISRRFSWPGLRREVYEYVRSCSKCRFNKAKFKPRADRWCLRSNEEPPMNTVHLDFAELTKRSGSGTRTSAFSVAIDHNTRFAAQHAHSLVLTLTHVVDDRKS